MCAATEYSGIADWPSVIICEDGKTQHSVGNVRARILCESDTDAVQVHLLWRRRDSNPQLKNVLVHSALYGLTLQNVVPTIMLRESGDLVLQTTYGPGEYHVYYMPFVEPYGQSNPFMYTTYDNLTITADLTWMKRNGLDQPLNQTWRTLPTCKVVEFQSRTYFDRFDDMQLIATYEELTHMLRASKAHTHPFLLFPDDRLHPLKMQGDMSLRWVDKGPSNTFTSGVRRNEFFVFQVGVFAHKHDVTIQNATFTPLTHLDDGTLLLLNYSTCFNLQGIDSMGNEFTRSTTIKYRAVNSLWFGMQFPEEAIPGQYEGSLTLSTSNGWHTNITLTFNISNTPSLMSYGEDDLWRFSRKWLNSKLGRTDQPTYPYTPVQVKGTTLTALNRVVILGEDGLVSSVQSNNRSILRAPMQFTIYNDTGVPVCWVIVHPITITTITPAATSWWALLSSYNGSLQANVSGTWNFDGTLEYSIELRVIGSRKVFLTDTILYLSLNPKMARFWMGLGVQGSVRNSSLYWRWQLGNSNHMMWLGDTHAGIRFKLKGQSSEWNSPTFIPKRLPLTWYNEGNGGVNITTSATTRAYTGPRVMFPGQSLTFIFDIIVTPLHNLDASHWHQRYYQNGYPDPSFADVETVKATGATIVNIHQGVDGWINPYINYPFLPQSVQLLHNYTYWAHKAGMLVKFYYTTRELTNHVSELFPLLSLDGEIFLNGTGQGTSWLYEHVVENYTACWQQWLTSDTYDASLCDSGVSRWENYYVEGFRKSIQQSGIDGIYFDGIAFTRDTMLRVRRVLDEYRQPGQGLFDLHAGNTFLPQYGLVSPAVTYMQLFPFINSLWFGEGFNYDGDAIYYLLEMSGIPYGLMGDMLGTANPWRGMLYGMTTRFRCADPTHIWKLWDMFGIDTSTMIGWWEVNVPVTVSPSTVLATVYTRQKRALIALASWDVNVVNATLAIDWTSLGLDPNYSILYGPTIEGYQNAIVVDVKVPMISVPVGQGYLLIAE